MDNSPLRCITYALRDAGYLGLYQDPSSERLAEGMNRLNDIFNVLQTSGLKLWLNQDLPITPIAGTNLYTLGPSGTVTMVKPMRALEGYFVDGSANRRPVMPISREEWDTLSTVNTQGTITSYFADKQQLSLNIYLWQTPDAIAAQGVFHAVLQEQVTQVVSLNDTMNFPTEWFLCLEWMYASQIAIGQPSAIMERCDMMAKYYLEKLENWDVEDAATSFAPDPRAFYSRGRFR